MEKPSSGTSENGGFNGGLRVAGVTGGVVESFVAQARVGTLGKAMPA